MQQNHQEAHNPEWRPETARTETRSGRVLSIEALRERLGLAGVERPAPETELRARPRIVWRREAELMME
jgi:hypothetical protein